MNRLAYSVKSIGQPLPKRAIMKKIALFILCSVVAIGAIRAAQDVSITEKELRDPKQLKVWLESNAADVQARTVAQTDTNATTTATSYTPVYVGQLLIGGDGAGTNGIWLAIGTTTNDWVQILP